MEVRHWSEASPLTYEEISGLKLAELVGNRVLLRDLHFTIEKSRRGVPSLVSKMLGTLTLEYEGEENEEKDIMHVASFPVSGEQYYMYFFLDEYPDSFKDTLKFEDVLPSGLKYVDLRKESVEWAMSEFKKRDYAFQVVLILNSEYLSLKDEVRIEEIKPYLINGKLPGMHCRVYIECRKSLKMAIDASDEYTLKMLGLNSPNFTKLLHRSDGLSVECYNHLRSQWQKTDLKLCSLKKLKETIM